MADLLKSKSNVGLFSTSSSFPRASFFHLHPIFCLSSTDFQYSIHPSCLYPSVLSHPHPDPSPPSPVPINPLSLYLLHHPSLPIFSHIMHFSCSLTKTSVAAIALLLSSAIHLKFALPSTSFTYLPGPSRKSRDVVNVIFNPHPPNTTLLPL